ncbi:RRQRL motif-containing zinc-binding protein [Streptomyces sp. enrichment culture]|uniref:RRQRL motif-containing zinc-binding protein n=1 Tax=Streptomyces sp. enrichment culture TaxID=1795815 RepID=UPI003F5435C3
MDSPDDNDLVDVDLYDDGGFPEFGNNQAPGCVAVRAAARGKAPTPKEGLATRRQLRAMGLSPGGHDPVARLICRGGNRWAWLYRVDLAVPKRTPTLAQELALDRAMAARQTCPTCRRRYYACLPLRTQGQCEPCDKGYEPSADTVMTYPDSAAHRLAA